MRTTIVLDDALFKQAKKQAAEAGLSLSALVERSLRDSLSRDSKRSENGAYRVVTFGDPANPVDHDPADFSSALVDEEG
ncbi:MAG: hypothetical protein HYV07_18110 [Deltaproteobacteria bacterium]|nr:hypothetical protein [Deltaproteobacteria bacterium]